MDPAVLQLWTVAGENWWYLCIYILSLPMFIMDLQLADKTAIVLASSSGLGRAVAQELVLEGADVIISSSNQANLDTATALIEGAVGDDSGSVDSVCIDLSDPDSIDTGMSTALEQLGGLDILVTNHGGPKNNPFEESTLEDFDTVYNNVLRSTVHACKRALPALKENGGAITHLIGASTLEPNVNSAVSNVIRPGIYGLSKTLANEYGEYGIRVNCVAPRGVMSDRIEQKVQARAERQGISVEDAYEQRIDELPLPRLGTPEDFAKATAYISSPVAAYTTGSILHVDGGWSGFAF